MALYGNGENSQDLAVGTRYDPDLAGKLGKTVQNMSAKLRRDNLSEKELQDIAKACNATFVGGFILNDTKKEIK